MSPEKSTDDDVQMGEPQPGKLPKVTLLVTPLRAPPVMPPPVKIVPPPLSREPTLEDPLAGLTLGPSMARRSSGTGLPPASSSRVSRTQETFFAGRRDTGKARDLAGSDADNYAAVGMTPPPKGELAASRAMRQNGNDAAVAAMMRRFNEALEKHVIEAAETSDFLTRGMRDANDTAARNTTATADLANMVSRSNGAMNTAFDTIASLVAQGTEHGARLDQLRADRNQRVFNMTHTPAVTTAVPLPPISTLPRLSVLFTVTRGGLNGATLARTIAERSPGLTFASIMNVRETTTLGSFVVHFRSLPMSAAFIAAVAGSASAQDAGVSAAYAGSADVLGGIFGSGN
ncbi:hypothetical protein BDZ89DRAFT_1131120 [Hymenopellis radicata]|nr:hypothetical protein BDZ89DRAFT_1131120 [Hymenopellis radicata]